MLCLCFHFLNRCHIILFFYVPFSFHSLNVSHSLFSLVFPCIHLLHLSLSAGYNLGHLLQRGNFSSWLDVWMWLRWHVDSSNESLIPCHFYSLVNSSIRMHTIYKRNFEDIWGCILSCKHHMNSIHSIQFAFLSFFFLCPQDCEWSHSVLNVGGRISLRNWKEKRVISEKLWGTARRILVQMSVNSVTLKVEV